MDAVILAGGKGTRLGLKNLPKPMVDFDGLPLIHRQLIKLDQAEVFNKIYILTGYLGDTIESYFESIIFQNIKLYFFQEAAPLGTAGALKQLLNQEISERFLVVYGDTYLDIDFYRFIEFDNSLRAPLGTLFIHPNDHPYDSDLVVLVGNYVKKVLPKPHNPNHILRNFANAALYILDKKIFSSSLEFDNKDLGRDIFPFLPEKSFAAYLSSEYIKDIGTIDRLNDALRVYKSGLPNRKNLNYKQKAVFFDRDGIINFERKPFVNLSNFKIYNDLIPFLKVLRKKEYLLFIVTNQPVIAKGFLSLDELDKIHFKLEKGLIKEKLYFDEIKFCPHHPEKGFPGELPEYKIACNCRKPDTGMISSLVSHYNIDVENSFLIGDRYTDIKAGNDSGLNTILIRRGLAGNDHQLFPNTIPDQTFNSLTEINLP